MLDRTFDVGEQGVVGGERLVVGVDRLVILRQGALDLARRLARAGPRRRLDQPDAGRVIGVLDGDGGRQVVPLALVSGVVADLRDGFEESGDRLARPRRLADELGGVDDHVVVEVRVVIGRRVDAAAADVVGVAEDLDQAVAQVALLVFDVAREVDQGVLVAAQGLGQLVGVVEDRHRPRQGFAGAFLDLLEVGQALDSRADVEKGGVDVEGHHAARQAEGIEAGVGAVEGGLDLAVVLGDLGDFRHPGAVDLADLGEARGYQNAVVAQEGLEIGVERAVHRSRLLPLVGQERVGRHPVEVGAVAGAARPARQSPGALGIRVLVALPLAGRVAGGAGHPHHLEADRQRPGVEALVVVERQGHVAGGPGGAG